MKVRGGVQPYLGGKPLIPGAAAIAMKRGAAFDGSNPMDIIRQGIPQVPAKKRTPRGKRPVRVPRAFR